MWALGWPERISVGDVGRDKSNPRLRLAHRPRAYGDGLMGGRRAKFTERSLVCDMLFYAGERWDLGSLVFTIPPAMETAP